MLFAVRIVFVDDLKMLRYIKNEKSFIKYLLTKNKRLYNQWFKKVILLSESRYFIVGN